MTSHLPVNAQRVFYHNGRLTGKLTYWNNVPWERTLFEYFDESSRYSVQTLIYQGRKLSLMRKDLYQTSGLKNAPDQKIETWYYYYGKNETNALRQVDTYWPRTSLVRERQLFDASGGLKMSAVFEYESPAVEPQYDQEDLIPGLQRMILMDDEGRKVLDYREPCGIDIEALYRGLDLPEAEIQRRLKLAKEPRRQTVLIMDGGIDMGHPELAYKIWQNPHEKLNGLDDDDNGLVDDVYGVSDNPRLHIPAYDLRLPRFGLPPFSHGTLVASMAVQGREDVAIMVASELTAHNSDQIVARTEQLIRAHHVRFTNMSYVFDKQLIGFEGLTERPLQIKALIAHTPETLHVAAAGNGAPLNGKGFNMDSLRKQEDLVPAMLTLHNILVVGALDTSVLVYADYPRYRMADFSNFGVKSVDILAPGTRMCGAQMGGGTICKDGTSFAAPYVLNHGVMEVARANPGLNIYQIKELLIKSAYIPSLEKPFAVSSGGIVHPRRAVEAALWMAANPGCSVEQAVLVVRKTEQDPIPGEGRNNAYLQGLKEFWARRGIGNSDQWLAESLQGNEITAAIP